MNFEEQDQLAKLLERFIEGEQPMLTQLEKTPMTKPIAKQYRERVDAATFLLKHLRSGERMDVGGQ